MISDVELRWIHICDASSCKKYFLTFHTSTAISLLGRQCFLAGEDEAHIEVLLRKLLSENRTLLNIVLFTEDRIQASMQDAVTKATPIYKHSPDNYLVCGQIKWAVSQLATEELTSMGRETVGVLHLHALKTTNAESLCQLLCFQKYHAVPLQSNFHTSNLDIDILYMFWPPSQCWYYVQ